MSYFAIGKKMSSRFAHKSLFNAVFNFFALETYMGILRQTYANIFLCQACFFSRDVSVGPTSPPMDTMDIVQFIHDA